MENRPVDRRAMRKRGVLRLAGEAVSEARAWADRRTALRLRRVNAVGATAFLIGGSLFAVGAALAQGGADATAYCSVYLAGGVFFTTGGYAGVLQAVNAPREVGADGLLSVERWRWWATEPDRIEWVSATSLFVGTLVFGINLVDSFVQGLGAGAENRLVWSPDMVGCSLFLISGYFGFLEFGPGWRWRPRAELGWWIVAVNQVGSILFMVAAVASFVSPSSGEEVSVGIANWGTLTGALCFAVAGLMQEFERPSI